MNPPDLFVCCVTHGGLSLPTTRLLLALQRAGAGVSVLEGTADLAGGRNRQLNTAAASPLEMALLVDDDIAATPDQALAVCAIPDGYAAQSALYVRADGAEAAFPRGNNRYHTGLGLFAIRTATLREMRPTLPSYDDDTKYAYCQCAPKNGHWAIDDEWLCDNLEPWGGVHLARNIKVGHVKQMVLWPQT